MSTPPPPPCVEIDLPLLENVSRLRVGRIQVNKIQEITGAMTKY